MLPWRIGKGPGGRLGPQVGLAANPRPVPSPFNAIRTALSRQSQLTSRFETATVGDAIASRFLKPGPPRGEFLLPTPAACARTHRQ